jgi:hypothetical protein
LTIALPHLLTSTASDYPFGILTIALPTAYLTLNNKSYSDVSTKNLKIPYTHPIFHACQINNLDQVSSWFLIASLLHSPRLIAWK